MVAPERVQLDLGPAMFLEDRGVLTHDLLAHGRACGSSFVQRRDIRQAFAFTEASAANEPEIAVLITFQTNRWALELGISGKQVSFLLDNLWRAKAQVCEGPLQPGYLVHPIFVRCDGYQKEAAHRR